MNGDYATTELVVARVGSGYRVYERDVRDADGWKPVDRGHIYCSNNTNPEGKRRAVAWAEGRQSATGQAIRMHGGN